MREVSRVLIIDKERIVFIHRFKNGKEFYVLPGGGVEKGEDSFSAAVREAKEETNLDVKIDKFLWKMNNLEQEHSYFLVKEFSGELKLNGPESLENCETNSYSPEWVDVKKIDSLLIYPPGLKDKIKHFIEQAL